MEWLDRKSLARISHQLSTADPQCCVLTALRSIWVLNGLPGTLARPNLRAPCHYAPLRSLATKPGEKCGLAAGFGRKELTDKNFLKFATFLALFCCWAAVNAQAKIDNDLPDYYKSRSLSILAWAFIAV